jgi:hypothetical protein
MADSVSHCPEWDRRRRVLQRRQRLLVGGRDEIWTRRKDLAELDERRAGSLLWMRRSRWRAKLAKVAIAWCTKTEPICTARRSTERVIWPTEELVRARHGRWGQGSGSRTVWRTPRKAGALLRGLRGSVAEIV